MTYKKDLIKSRFDFKRYLENRNKAKGTVYAYGLDVEKFFDYLEEKGISYNMKNFTKDDFIAYINFLKDSGFESSTIKRKVYSLHEFISFLYEEGKIEKVLFARKRDLTDLIPVIKDKPVEVLDLDTIKSLIESAESLTQECIIRFFYSTACRISELVEAKWEDIKEENGAYIITIYGKGKGGMSKLRKAHIQNKAMEKLLEMKETRDWDSVYIFESDRHKGKLSRFTINRHLKDMGKKIGLEDKIHPHMLRKTTGTMLLEQGLDLAYVSDYLGHSDVNITKKNYLDTQKSVIGKVSKTLQEV
ncbi:integrase [Bacillus phage v_B-Bak10]|uniref:Integrase n=2 Tax=Basiliskvirus TaxID=3044670 RepID=A0A385IK24_9CAUD|nr:integrase [Bacillus phage Basilisk]YP_010657001.1 integrase [Bacillus phage v_B-Bak10]AGR46648.1 tyrosine recombinase XerD [Bacillus phage Basilisk]AXY83220.1 tyrosine recombinase [Bacillus phage v_B-Bak10]